MPVLLQRPGRCYPVELARGDHIAMGKLDDDKPPFFETWPRLYAFVAGYLFFLIALFYAFTRAYQFLP